VALGFVICVLESFVSGSAGPMLCYVMVTSICGMSSLPTLAETTVLRLI
jgi:hypothetical protein